MTRADIIQAAFKVWGRDYYRTTSLSEVARDLGVSKTALYRHFRGKQALLEAMYEWFRDDYTAQLGEGFSRIAAAADLGDALYTLVQVVMRYYARNDNLFIFSLAYLFMEQRRGDSGEFPLKRKPNGQIVNEVRRLAPSPEATQFILTTLTFSMIHFHRHRRSRRAGAAGAEFTETELEAELEAEPKAELKAELADAEIEREISLVCCIIFQGLGFSKSEIDVLDYGLLEAKVSGINRDIEENTLLRCVAEAVAGAGPWGVSMEMVARVSGLSKSGLYAHFTNKQDMLLQLFVTEFSRIIDFAEESMKLSEDPAERLYLAIFAICDYLRSRPDVLIAMDWLWIQRTGVSEPGEQKVPSRFFRIFRDLRCSPELERRFSGLEDDWIPAWALFLIVAFLMQGIRADSKRFGECMPKGSGWKFSREEFAKLSNESFRNLYRIITLGIGDPTWRSASGIVENWGTEQVRR
ncbi:MAG: TetR/AcrR family transcriptional regulator [Treponema sp.]|jgi:AcrR family transcriptional regulator|nr:TetR/AcrR family transcriptional regulator [Treponema sp.]